MLFMSQGLGGTPESPSVGSEFYFLKGLLWHRHVQSPHDMMYDRSLKHFKGLLPGCTAVFKLQCQDNLMNITMSQHQ